MKNKTDIKSEIKGSSHKAIKRIAKILGNVVFALLVIVAAAIVFFTVQSKMAGGTPKIAGYNLYTVLSGSMEPALHTGSIVLVKPVSADTLAVNDVVTFKGSDGSQLVTHRIVAVTPGEPLAFTTRGDANDANDQQPLLASAVVGKVIKTIPYVGFAMNFIRSKIGLLVLVILPGALIAVLEMWKLFGYAVQLDRKKQEKIRAELEERATAERGEVSGRGV